MIYSKCQRVCRIKLDRRFAANQFPRKKLGVGISGAHMHHCVEASNSYRLEAATFRKAKAMQEIYRGEITEGGGKLPIINNLQ